MPDPDAPPRAQSPRAVLPLVYAALAAGDVEAAAALYSPDAVLDAWDRRLTGSRLRAALASLAALRVPIRFVEVAAEPSDCFATPAGAVVVGGLWHVEAATHGCDCPVVLDAVVVAVVAPSPERGWRITGERWTVALPSAPPGAPRASPSRRDERRSRPRTERTVHHTDTLDHPRGD